MGDFAITVVRDEEARAHDIQRRMHSKLCGLVTSVGGFNRYLRAPRLYVEGGELTGVHVWQNRSAPKPGSYHIGGYGFLPYESRIRVLGETVERYAGHAIVAENRFPIVFATHDELHARGEPVLEAEAFRLFSEEQLARPGFPYQPFETGAPMGWIRLPILTAGEEFLVPAQEFLLGYVPRQGEPWLISSVSTGTAAHTSPESALRGGLHELIQIDSAIGHWHGCVPSVRIELDNRLRAISELLRRRVLGSTTPEFHYLPNPDLPGFSVACLLRMPTGAVPAVSVGLGSGTSLRRAVYRGLLEAVGVQALAVWSFLEARLDGESAKPDQVRLASMYDLEANVGYYSDPSGAELVERRFAHHTTAKASELPPDDERPARAVTRHVVDRFRATGKRLFWADITARDIRDLGFTVIRVWSPDTISLPLPSAPPAAHTRFDAYGGFVNRLPHPYP
jgi:ribosomal protein S12 methylthiotransferase accessory factor